MAADMKIGSKIRELRLGSDLTQSELADRADLTKGFISQLENEQTSISVDSLKDILDVLGVSMAEFFAETANVPVVFTPEQRIHIDGKGVTRFDLLVPGSTNNLMDPTLVELEPGDQLEKQGPFAGEVFGYVLKGTVTLLHGKKKHKVPRRYCFYFKAVKEHQISNLGNTTASMLMVTSPPQM